MRSPRGRFVWFDLLTTDPAAGAGFYSRVTGWGTSRGRGPTAYTMWTSDGAPLGGVGKLDQNEARRRTGSATSRRRSSMRRSSRPSISARATLVAADRHSLQSAGLRSSPIRTARRSRSLRRETDTRDTRARRELREFSWHELATHDYPAAFRFYERLFGWEKTSAMDMGEARDVSDVRPQRRHARRHVQRVAADARAARLAALRSGRRLNRAVDAVKSGGGQVLNGPMEVPGGDWIAQCMDPQGAMFAVHARKK